MPSQSADEELGYLGNIRPAVEREGSAAVDSGAADSTASVQEYSSGTRAQPARSGLTISDGFRFGCGFILAFVAFYFAAIILVTGSILLAMLLNVPVPAPLLQPLKLLIALFG
ncbi:MAG: hypothetical protein HY675_27825 [Chloroflexi bacterium]|nr:hypothetical protein [Chloroflexota bacterium]